MPEYQGPRSIPGAPGIWFKEAWALFRARPGVWIVTTLVPWLVTVFVTVTFASIMGSQERGGSGTSSETKFDADILLGFDILLLPLYVIAQSFMASNVMSMAFAQMQGGAISVKDAFQRPPNLGKMVLVYCACALLIGVAFMGCIVPGLLLACALLFAPFFAADGASAFSSMTMSFATAQSRWALVARLGFCVICLWGVGLALCGIGFLVIQLCVGLFVVVGLLMPAPAMIADGESAVNAVSRSIQAMKSDWLTAGLFVFVYMLLYFASALPCGLGIFVTLPMAVIISALAYRDLGGMQGVPPPQNPYGSGPNDPGAWPPSPSSGGFGQAPPIQ